MIVASDAADDPLTDAGVGQLLHQEVCTADASETVSKALALLTTKGLTAEDYLAVCEGSNLLGILRLGQLLRAAPAEYLGAMPVTSIPSVNQSTTAEEAAWITAHAAAEAVGIVDDAGALVGVLPAHRLLPVLVREHEVDMARLGGFLEGTSRARTASEEPLTRRVWHRAPWLLVGLLGAVLAAKIVSSFEGKLENQVSLAFFLPGIIYMADAVGTQTETLLIRGLSVGVSFRRILRLELFTGTIVGVMLSLAVFPFALLLTGELRLAAVVSLSLLAATSCATLIAMSLPWTLQRLNFDPAFGSGPMATVIQDLLSLVIYFAIAAALLES